MESKTTELKNMCLLVVSSIIMIRDNRNNRRSLTKEGGCVPYLNSIYSEYWSL